MYRVFHGKVYTFQLEYLSLGRTFSASNGQYKFRIGLWSRKNDLRLAEVSLKVAVPRPMCMIIYWRL